MPTAAMLLLLVLLCTNAGGQSSVTPPGALQMARYFQSDGLSANSIHALAADPRGFLWVGTEDGLNFFDGYRFLYQRRKPGITNSLAWNNISALATDVDGSVWIGSIRHGVSIFHPGTDSFDHVRVPTVSAGDDWVTAIALASHEAWIAGEHGVVLIDKGSLQQKAMVITGIPVQAIFPGADGCLLFLVDGSVWEAGRNGAVHTKTGAAALFGFKPVVADVRRYDGVYEIITSEGWYRWHGPGSGPAERQSVRTITNELSRSAFTRYLKDSRGREWLGRKGEGLLVRTSGSDFFVPCTASAATRSTPSDNNVSCLQEDGYGNIWIGTQNGLNRVLKYRSWITTYRGDQGSGSATFHRVQAVCTGENEALFIGARNGLFVYDRKQQAPAKIKPAAGVTNERFYFIKPFEQETWVTGSYAGVQVLRKTGSQYVLEYDERYPELKKLQKRRITSFLVLNANEFLLGGIDAGLWRWNKKSHQLVNAGVPAGKTDFNIYHLLKAEGRTWAATNKGLYIFDDKGNALKKVQLQFESFTAEPHINCLAYSNGELWLAFTSEGIGRYHIATGKLKVYNTENLLRNNITYSIVADRSGRIWASGVTGIVKIEPGDEKISYYTSDDGIQGNEFTNFAFWQNGDDVFFGGMNGLTVIHTDLYRPLQKLPPAFLTYAEVLRGSQFVPWPVDRAMRFVHDQNSINFRFALPDISQQHRVHYLYRLLPLAKEWINNESSPDVSLTNLSPGFYTLQVACASNDSESSAVNSVRFSILPAWYQTLFFKLLVTLLSLLLLFLLVRWYYLARLRKQRMEYEKLLAVQEERQRISSEIHDDIGADLSGIRLLSEMAAKKSKQSNITQEVETIQFSVAALSAKMREVIWSLNSENDHLESLVCYISQQAKSLFENSGLALDVQLPGEDLPHLEIAGAKRRHIYLAVKEALHNCIKHAGGSCCCLKMQLQNEALCITVSDNGSGMKDRSGSPGMGMTTMKKSMKAVGGEMNIYAEAGTTVQFKIPVYEMDRVDSRR